MRRFFCVTYGLLVLACGLLLGAVGYVSAVLPDAITVGQNQAVQVGRFIQGQPIKGEDSSLSAVSQKTGNRYRSQLNLLGFIPVKEVAVTVSETRSVMVCGTPFGIKLYTDGVLVVGLQDVTTAAGNVNPAAAAGVCLGDTILSVNGEEVTSNRDLSRLINASQGKRITLRLRRDGVEFSAAFTPVRPADESGYKAGIWVRDSSAGVGTLTFYDPTSGVFAGLGHPVCDVDTGEAMPLSGGQVVPARVFGVTKSTAGTPGELKGTFEPGVLGSLSRNGQNGLYGTLTTLPSPAVSLPVAHRQQVQEGRAQILATLDGTQPRYYDVMVEQVRYGGATARNMVVRITDPELINLAGGIVQGMSGSPLIQDGKLIGAVTHVFINDPQRGYAIFAEDMLSTADGVAQQKILDNAS